MTSTTETTYPRGRVWRETYSSTARGQTHDSTQWRWGIGTWEDGWADTWQNAYRECSAAVASVRRPSDPPF